MKMTTLASGGMPGANLNSTGPSATKLAAAKAIAAGETPISVTSIEGETDRTPEPEKRKIRMRTNVSPDRFDGDDATQEQAQSAILDSDVPAQVVEDTKPLSPQVAALAKERRAIQRERMELEALKKELESRTPMNGSEELVTKLKAKPLSVLLEHGVTYDQITEELLSQSSGLNPEIQSLKAELKALKEGVDRTLSDRDTRAEQQVLAEMQKEAVILAKTDDTFELVREEGCIPDVMKLIHRTYKETGEVLDVSEAMQLVEDELLKDNLRRIKFKKIQSQLTPTQQPVQQRQNQMRTLTNRDSSSNGLSRRERAIMAAKGLLTKG